MHTGINHEITEYDWRSWIKEQQEDLKTLRKCFVAFAVVAYTLLVLTVSFLVARRNIIGLVIVAIIVIMLVFVCAIIWIEVNRIGSIKSSDDAIKAIHEGNIIFFDMKSQYSILAFNEIYDKCITLYNDSNGKIVFCFSNDTSGKYETDKEIEVYSKSYELISVDMPCENKVLVTNEGIKLYYATGLQELDKLRQYKNYFNAEKEI